MALRVLIMPDKFKGTLTAAEAAEAIARGWRRVRPEDATTLLPLGDGGDGFGQILSDLIGAKPQKTETVDAAHRPCTATWWWHGSLAFAVIESARVIGLAQLPPGKFHPFDLDTAGLGAVLKAASDMGARRILMGIGGSATNDAGFGMARVLGWRFLASKGQLIKRWIDLHQLARLEFPQDPLRFDEVTVAVDVRNPLLGPNGCSRIYGPQKGLREFDQAERSLRRLSKVLSRDYRLDCAEEPGAGAAGGLGYGLRCFLGAALEPGFALYAHYAKLAERLDKTDLVLTGEGAIDPSTLMGKGVGELAGLCQHKRIPCIGFGGLVTSFARDAARFSRTYALTPDYTTRERAMSDSASCLEAVAAQAAAAWQEIR